MREVLWRVVQKAVLCMSEKIHLVLHLHRLFLGDFLRALRVLLLGLRLRNLISTEKAEV